MAASSEVSVQVTDIFETDGSRGDEHQECLDIADDIEVDDVEQLLGVVDDRGGSGACHAVIVPEGPDRSGPFRLRAMVLRTVCVGLA